MLEETFAAVLQRELRRREWSQGDLARRVGTNGSVVSRWLRGTRPSPEFVERVADVLGLDVDELLTIAGHRPRQLADEDPRRAELMAKLRQAQLTDDRYHLLAALLETMRIPPSISDERPQPRPRKRPRIKPKSGRSLARRSSD